MIQSIIGTSFTGGGYNPPPVTFVASNYNPIEGTTITFTISGITGVSEGTFLYWWIDGTSGQFSRADQFVENIDNDTLQLYTDGSGTLGGQFTLTPNQGDIDFNIYIGYSLYGGFLNLSSDVVVTNAVNDFTIEWWQKMETSIGTRDILFNVGDSSLTFFIQLQSNILGIVINGTGRAVQNQNIPGLYNTWVHFSIVRDSNVLTLYKNGTSFLSFENNSLIQNNSDDLQIANGLSFVDNYFQGYITNFHFLKGFAKYNGNFTPSTEPIVQFLETNLLLSVTSSNTTFIDSTGNHVASVIGGTWSSQSPFSDGSGSIYFDGSSYLGFPGSDDWAIDVVESFPFDITANWSLTTPEVVDEASFRTFLESGEDGDGDTSNLTDVVITDFLLEGGRLRCNLSATGVYFYLAYMEISLINGIGNILGIKELRINNNQIVTFDPTQALPNSLELISIPNNQIVTFNPSIPLPNSLINLSLANNQIVTFDPSIALPSSLEVLTLSYNQMTTAGYTASESWANAMSVIPNRGTINFDNNINGVIGTNLESILVSKGWTVQGNTDLLPFDVTANWGLITPEVVDETSFITFLESGEDGDGNTNSQTGVVVTDFLLEGNRLRCNVSSTGAVDPKKGAAMNVVLAFANMGVTDFTSFGNLVYNYLYLYGNNISSVDDISWSIGITRIDLGENSITSFDNVTWPSTLDYLGLYSNALTSFNPATLPSGITELDLSNCQLTTVDDIVWPGSLQDLYLGNNQIITFNPSVALPSTLIFIGLDNNLIVDFDPSIALPNSLEEIGLNGNQIITFDPSLALPSSLIYLTLSSNQIVTFDTSQALPNSLQQLYLGGNQIVTFNPSQALPSGLELLEINNNQMTTAGYTASESWANAMSVIPNRGTINFDNNINGVIGTNLESILVSKGWTVQGDPALLPFDITANWGLTTPEVVDEASFITFLESGQDGNNNTNSLINVTITDFSLDNGKLICNLSATGINLYLDKIEISDIVSFGNIIGLQTLSLQGNQIVTFDPTTLPTGLQNLYLNSNDIVTFDPSIALPTGLKILEIRANQIVTFDPSIALPTGLQNLDLGANQIVTFDPTITLPSGLQRLYLNSNDIVTFDPTQALPNSLQYLVLNGNQIVTFDTSISLPSGLEYLILNSNQIVTFDPSIVLPNSLQQLNLNNNQIVTFDPSNYALPSSLQYLGLSNNQIVTFDPSQALPTALQNLVLGSNQIVTFNPSIALPNSLRVLSLNSNDIVTFDPSIALPNGLLELVLSGNQIVTFDPSNYALPSSLQYLGLSNNQIVTFDPSQALPSSLQYLDLGSNGIVTFDPSIALPNSLLGLYLNSNQIVTFDPSISLPTGLRNLLLSSNDIVTFDPTIALPNSLQSLRLESNQMTTTGYTNSESWANAMSVIPGRGNVQFTGNINSVSGTNLQTILISKGWTVTV